MTNPKSASSLYLCLVKAEPSSCSDVNIIPNGHAYRIKTSAEMIELANDTSDKDITDRITQSITESMHLDSVFFDSNILISIEKLTQDSSKNSKDVAKALAAGLIYKKIAEICKNGDRNAPKIKIHGAVCETLYTKLLAALDPDKTDNRRGGVTSNLTDTETKPSFATDDGIVSKFSELISKEHILKPFYTGFEIFHRMAQLSCVLPIKDTEIELFQKTNLNNFLISSLDIGLKLSAYIEEYQKHSKKERFSYESFYNETWMKISDKAKSRASNPLLFITAPHIVDPNISKGTAKSFYQEENSFWHKPLTNRLASLNDQPNEQQDLNKQISVLFDSWNAGFDVLLFNLAMAEINQLLAANLKASFPAYNKNTAGTATFDNFRKLAIAYMIREMAIAYRKTPILASAILTADKNLASAINIFFNDSNSYFVFSSLHKKWLHSLATKDSNTSFGKLFQNLNSRAVKPESFEGSALSKEVATIQARGILKDEFNLISNFHDANLLEASFPKKFTGFLAKFFIAIDQAINRNLTPSYKNLFYTTYPYILNRITVFYGKGFNYGIGVK